MKSVIKEIFYGRRGLSDNVKSSEEYHESYNKFYDVYKILKRKLPEEFQKDFDLLNSLFDERELEAADSHYVEGVKLGILIGIEACN